MAAAICAKECGTKQYRLCWYHS